MPLHLLHHKSWHVYSADNVAKVKADEAAAAAAEAAEATASASARLESLRDASTSGVSGITTKPSATLAETAVSPAVSTRPTTSSAEADHINKLGLTTNAGHINLFPAPRRDPNAPNPEAEAERKAAAAKFDAQFNSSLGRPGEAKPWYVSQQAVDEHEQIAGRKQRVQQRRKDLEDPMAAMQEGLRATKEVEELKSKQLEESRRREREVNRELHAGRRGEDGERRRRRRTDGDDGREKRRRSRSRDRRRSASPDRKKHRHRNRSAERKRSASPGKRRDPRRSGEHRHGESRHHRSSRQKEREKDREDDTKLQERKEREKYGDDGSASWKPAPGGRYSSQFGIGEVRQQ